MQLKDENKEKKEKIVAGICVFLVASVFVLTNVTDEKTKPVDQKVKVAESNNSIKIESKLTDEQEIKKAIIKVVGEDQLIDFNYVPENNFILVKFEAADNISSNFIRKGARLDMFNILKAIQPLTNYNVDFNVMWNFSSATDVYGNSTEPEMTKVIQAEFKGETIQKINFSKALWENVEKMADDIWIHDSFKL